MLQGSLEDFSLDEVLGLVASTNKTGELRVDGDRGNGRVWLDGGALVAGSCSIDADAPAGTTDERPIADTIFELLRFRSGSFSFISGIELPSDDRHDVDEVLAAASKRVEEWTAIEAVVPSLDHVVRPADELDAETVTLDRDDWRTLVAIGEERRIGTVIERLGLDEVVGSRRLKDLVERSLLTVGDAPVTESPAPTVSALSTAPTPVAEPVVAETAPTPALPTTDLPSADLPATEVPDVLSPFTAGAEADTPVELAPPSPGEIEDFGTKLDEPFDPTALVVEDPASLVSDSDEHSLLMRYLKSDS